MKDDMNALKFYRMAASNGDAVGQVSCWVRKERKDGRAGSYYLSRSAGEPGGIFRDRTWWVGEESSRGQVGQL